MNYIQEKTSKVSFYTSLRDVARWLEIDLRDFDWHISDVDGGWAELDDPAWIFGNDLKAKIEEYDYQFNWAVLSAFPRGTKPFTSGAPYADGNPEFWEGIPKKQLSRALFEIVCWDSSATLFIGLPEDLGHNLVRNAPSIKDLNRENEQRKC